MVHLGILVRSEEMDRWTEGQLVTQIGISYIAILRYGNDTSIYYIIAIIDIK